VVWHRAPHHRRDGIAMAIADLDAPRRVDVTPESQVRGGALVSSRI
jgi:hypothetical protein